MDLRRAAWQYAFYNRHLPSSSASDQHPSPTPIDHLARRFLSVTLAEKDRAVLVEFVRGRPRTEDSLRELLYLVFSMPEYQLG